MEIFTLTFIQYAFFAGILMALLAGVLGPFVVSAKQSITSDMLAHIALAGVGLAAVFSFLPLVGAFFVLIFGAILLWWITEKEWYSPDALSLFFLSGGLAFALFFIHLAKNQTISFENYLFGSILTITSSELLLMTVFTILAITLLIFFWYPLLGSVQTPSYRIPYSYKPRFVHLLFFLLLAITVWIGLKTIGGLLIGALLVIPALIAKNYTSSFRKLVFISTGVSCLGVFLGLFFALFVDIPPSSSIIFTLIFFFLLSLIFRK